MLENSGEPLFGHPDQAEEEHRLLNELTCLDQQLRTKTSCYPQHQAQKPWGNKQQAGVFHKNTDCFAKDSYPGPIYNPHMEYFSQIFNEEVEDDSLFDPHNNFLAPPKPDAQVDLALPPQAPTTRPKKKDFGVSQETRMLRKSSLSQVGCSNQSQLLKERDYVYKKEMQNCVVPSPKVPISSKNGLNYGKNGSTAALRAEKGKEKGCNSKQKVTRDRIMKDASRQRYIAKPTIIQEQLSMGNSEENQFQFHTFEPCLHDGLREEQPDRQHRKNTRCKHEQFDRDSLQCTFKPTILKKSSQMAKSTKHVVERLSAAGPLSNDKKPYQKLKNKQPLNISRIEQLSQPRRLKTQAAESEEMPSFRPSLSKKSLEQMSNCIYDVATRNQLWLQQRQEKISRLRQEEQRERQKRQDCTYSPSLCTYKGDNGANLSKFGRQGMMNYFERLSMNSKGSKAKLMEGKENKQSNLNLGKENYVSKGGKKQRYDQAVKELHNRIMGLKI